MRSNTIERTLSDTNLQIGTLQENLVTQFRDLHENERTRAFLGQEAPEGLMSSESVLFDPQEEVRSPVLSFVSSELQQTAVALQKWEGVVIAIEGDTFVARLTDQSENSPDEEVEMSLRDISDDDKKLLQLGAIFYWSIGYETNASGQIKRTSVTKFRRLPAWTQRELTAIKKKAAGARSAIGWGKKDATASQAG